MPFLVLFLCYLWVLMSTLIAYELSCNQPHSQKIIQCLHLPLISGSSLFYFPDPVMVFDEFYPQMEFNPLAQLPTGQGLINCTHHYIFQNISFTQSYHAQPPSINIPTSTHTNTTPSSAFVTRHGPCTPANTPPATSPPADQSPALATSATFPPTIACPNNIKSIPLFSGLSH